MATHSSILAWRIPTDRGACQAIVLRVGKTGTWLKWLSIHAHTRGKMQKSNLKDEIRCSSCKQLNCLIQNEKKKCRTIFTQCEWGAPLWCSITVTIDLSSHVPLSSESEGLLRHIPSAASSWRGQKRSQNRYWFPKLHAWLWITCLQNWKIQRFIKSITLSLN